MITKFACRSKIAVGSIAAAMMLTAPVRPSHAATDVFAVFKKSGPIVVGVPIVELAVPAGKYAILAKINVDNDGTSFFETVKCELKAGADRDINVIRLQPSKVEWLDNAVIPFQIAEELHLRSAISLTCSLTKDDPIQNYKLAFRSAKITAVRLQGTLCELPSPAICRLSRF